MNAISALVYFVLSVFGFDLGSHVYVDRIRADGIDTLYSRVVVQPTVTRFECLRSASGQCYYTVLPPQCSPRPGATSGSVNKRTRDCLSEPIERFVLTKGGSRQIRTLPEFRLCVSAEAGSVGSDCDGSEE